MERQHIISTLTKCFSAIILLSAYSLLGFSQASITVRFSGQLNGSYQRLDSVKVTDISKGWTETVYYPDTIAILSQTNNLGTISSESDALYQNVPNPFDCTTTAELAISKQSDINLQLVDVNGRILTSYNGTLNAGTHKFEISAEKPQTYLLNAQVGTKSYSIRMVNVGNGCGNAIKYIGESQDITAKLECLNQFTIGDNMGYTGYATINGHATASNTVIQQQIANQHITLDFNSQSTMPEVTTLPATNVGATTAIMRGYLSNGGQNTTLGFLYGSDPDNLQYNVIATASSSEEFSYRLTGLEPNTTYYYKAYATNSLGTATGDVNSFTTEEATVTHDITVRFTAQGHSTNYQYLYLYARLDSVKVQNVTNNWTQTLTFP
ncbi:MAG: fibronectin type III domain-containing protein, partial [Bacteroidales bacterium]|nr:fibronectin type III domain-containing protein [Bacteroidales bacterium]